MTPSNEMCPICSYAGSAQYCEWPSPEQIRQGVVPLDSLPAAWWNNMWADATNRINEARDMIGQVITEINNVLCNAGICAASACTDQLYQSINKIRQVLATDSIPGSVVSSNAGGAVCVANDGTMSVNCFGNVAALTTSAHTVVGAVNELKSTYDCCISDLQTCTSTLSSGKAPTSHASADTTYGVGNASNYGHVKLSDTYDSSIGAAADGIAASQKALYCVYSAIQSSTPTCVACAGCNGSGVAFGTAATRNIRTLSAVGDTDYTTAANRCCVPDMNFLSYWNGAHCGSSSNLRYFCGGQFGSAAACAASAFLSASGCASDSAKLNGFSASIAATGNCIVQRDGNGYICGTYFNSNINDENINSYSGAALIFSGSDKWLRRTPPSYVCVGAAGYADNASYADNAGYATSAGTAAGSCYTMCLYITVSNAVCAYQSCLCNRCNFAVLAFSCCGPVAYLPANAKVTNINCYDKFYTTAMRVIF